MRRAFRIFLILAVLVVIALVIWLLTHPRQSGIPNTIAGNGVIEATEVDISAKVPGKILGLMTDEGHRVRRGELIAVLDNGEQRGQLEQAKGNTNATRQDLAALRAGSRPQEIASAQAQYDAAVSAVTDAQARLSLTLAGTRPEEINQQRAAVAQAAAQLSLLRAGTRTEEVAQQSAQVQQAQANLSNAQTELNRDQYLLAQGAIPRQQLDTATTQRDVAAAQLLAAQQRLTELHNGSRPQEIAAAQAVVNQAQQRLDEDLAGPRPQEVQEARAQVAQAQGQARAARAALALSLAGTRPETLAEGAARVQQAQGGQLTAATILSHTSVFAPADGTVTLRAVEPGEIVTVGEPIIRMAELPTVWIRVYVPEPQIGRLKLGQRANVTTDAFPTRVFAGRVSEIAEVPEFTPKNVQTQEERVKLVFGVKVQVDNPDQLLKPGMPGDALIFVGP